MQCVIVSRKNHLTRHLLLIAFALPIKFSFLLLYFSFSFSTRPPFSLFYPFSLRARCRSLPVSVLWPMRVRGWKIGPSEMVTSRRDEGTRGEWVSCERGREGRARRESGDGCCGTRGWGDGEGMGLKVELVVNRAVAKQPILFPLLRA